VYAFTVTQSGTFRIVLDATGSALDPILYMRSTCDAANTLVWCRNQGGVQESYLENLDLGTYYVFVDGDGQTQGSYTLTIDFTAPACGDGALNPDEECDDGNHDIGDGCDASCNFEAHAYESCSAPSPGQDVQPGHTLILGNDLGNADDHTWPNGACGATDDSGGGPDQVYVLVPAISGTMEIKLGYDATGDVSECSIDSLGPYCWDRILYVRHADGQSGVAVCSNIANEYACAPESPAPDFASDLIMSVTAGETYYLFIDSFWNGGGVPGYVSGPYYLHIYLNP
jgi:cysteine-rich repeat protein